MQMRRLPEFFTEYNHQDPVIDFTGSDSLARQEFRDEADINNIIKKYQATGCLIDPSLARSRMPQFGDFSAVPDFECSQQILARAREHFDALPDQVRQLFGNDPLQVLAFFDTPPDKRDPHIVDYLVRHSLIENPTKSVSPSKTGVAEKSPTFPAAENPSQES